MKQTIANPNTWLRKNGVSSSQAARECRRSSPLPGHKSLLVQSRLRVRTNFGSPSPFPLSRHSRTTADAQSISGEIRPQASSLPNTAPLEARATISLGTIGISATAEVVEDPVGEAREVDDPSE